eukprot:1159873-Pelagomonas_calceolata.AAC.14
MKHLILACAQGLLSAQQLENVAPPPTHHACSWPLPTTQAPKTHPRLMPAIPYPCQQVAPPSVTGLAGSHAGQNTASEDAQIYRVASVGQVRLCVEPVYVLLCVCVYARACAVHARADLLGGLQVGQARLHVNTMEGKVTEVDKDPPKHASSAALEHASHDWSAPANQPRPETYFLTTTSLFRTIYCTKLGDH